MSTDGLVAGTCLTSGLQAQEATQRMSQQVPTAAVPSFTSLRSALLQGLDHHHLIISGLVIGHSCGA